MIKQLRKKFIIVTMLSTTAVLLIIVGTLNIVSYKNLADRADMIITVLAENDYSFSNNRKKLSAVGVEAPFETRYFSVTLNSTGNEVEVDTGEIAAVNSNEALSYAKKVFQSNKNSGFYQNYRYKIIKNNAGSTVIFVDRTRELEAFKILLFTSISVSIIGLLMVFTLIVFFSKNVFKPIVANYAKQKQFITDASHELKTPLTIISANVDLLEIENPGSKWTKSIKNQITRLTSLTQQMVTLSRMDEEERVKAFSQFSLTDAILETTALFQAVIEKQEKQLSLDIDEDVSYLGDELLIRQMISLLVDNAVKYSSDNGRIEIILKPKGRRWQLTIYNDVPEIKKGNLDILFERFYRLDSSRNSTTGGSGIGLSIVKSIVNFHQGKINAYSSDGKSLLMTIIL